MRLVAWIALALTAGCVPKDFTYADCEGAGGGCTTSGTGGAGGGGGASHCGNGAVEADLGEECDDGSSNDDDQTDSTVGLVDAGPIGCTRDCKHTVQWTRDDAVTDQSVFTGVVAVSGGVVAGGFSLGGDTSIVLNRNDVAYSADRRIRAYGADGADVFTIDTKDAGLEGNGVLGMAPGAGDAIFYLESFHDVGVDRGTFVKVRDGQTESATSDKTSAEYFNVAIGPMADGAGALVVAYDLSGMVLHRVGATGTVSDVDISAVTSIAGDTFGAIAAAGTDIAVAWGSNVVLLDAIGNERFTVPYPGAELTGLCVRPDGVIVAVGWYDLDALYDPVIVWVDPETQALLGSVVITDSPDVDGANAVACDADGSIVVVGEEGLAGETNVLTPRSRAWVRRYAADRSLVWTRKHESYAGLGISDTDARAVAIAADGSIYVAGREMTSDDTASGWLRKYAP